MESLQYQQILIACDDGVGLGGEGRREDEVVVRIPADRFRSGVAMIILASARTASVTSRDSFVVNPALLRSFSSSFARMHPEANVVLLSAPKVQAYYPKIGMTQHPPAWTAPAWA